MAEVIWSEQAENQLRRAVQYIAAEQGTFYARIVSESILKAVDTLEDFPRSGQIEPLLRFKKAEYRYIVAWSYKIVYRLGKNKVVVARVFHTSQNPSKLTRARTK
jgi:plasmid stabilization system protein ParE